MLDQAWDRSHLDGRTTFMNRCHSFLVRTSLGWALAVTALPGIGCERRQKGFDEPLPQIVVAVYKGDVSALVYLAHDKGYFNECGIRVVLKEYEAGKLATDDLVLGQADISTAGEFVFIVNRAQHPELRVFGTVSVFRIDELIGRRDHGILKPADLKGKRVGVLQKATSEFFLGRFLELHLMSSEEVEIVFLNPSDIVDALLSGRIDAGQTWDPNVYHLKRELGDNTVVLLGQEDANLNAGINSEETFTLIARERWLNENREAAKRFLEGLLRAETYVARHPAETKEFMLQRFGLQEDYVDYVFPKIDFVVGLTQKLILTMEDETRWAIQTGVIGEINVPDYLKSVYLEPLADVRPEAVTVIR